MKAVVADKLTCAIVVEIITDYWERTLSYNLRAQFECHVTQCRGCAAYLAQMRSTLRLVVRTASREGRAKRRAFARRS